MLALLTSRARDEGARNRSLGLFSAVCSAGGSLGLILGGALTGYASWRWSLFINVPIGLLVLLLVPRFVDETPRQPGRFDVTGAVTATLGSASLVFGFINAPDHGWTSLGTVGAFALAVVLLDVVRGQRASRRVPAARARTCCAAGCGWARSR